MKEFLKNNLENIGIVCVTLILFWLIRPELDAYLALKRDVKTLQNARTYQDNSVVVAPNLPCCNCGGLTYQASHDEHSKMVSYFCCTCGLYKVTVEQDGAVLLPSKLKIFKQDYKKFKQGGLDYIDSHFIEGHAYHNNARELGRK